MNPGGGESRNDQFLTTLADELNETPAAELLDGGSPEDAQQLAARAVMSSREEAGRRGLLSGREPAAAALQGAAGEQSTGGRSALIASLQEGAVVRGTVKDLTDYGAFVDLGGIDGLLHITDMAWKRIKHPSEVVRVGEEIEVLILKLNRALGRASLGLKQLQTDPWENISQRYSAQTCVSGKVTSIADYGAFVEIEDGVEGLVHVSEMDWTNKNVNPAKVVHTGQEVEVMVLDVDEERRRISLGLKQCKSNPWKEFAENYNRGDKVSGQIKSITEFGLFIGLPGNIDGLVHLLDISWDQPGKEAVRNYQKGQLIEAMVLSIDPERERISLGVKQLAKDSFSAYIAANPKGTIVRGVVKEVDARGAIIDLGSGIDGLLHITDMAWKRVKHPSEAVNVGDEIDVLILKFERQRSRVMLGLKQLRADPWENIAHRYRPQTCVFGRVTGIAEYGALVEVEEGVEGLVHIWEMDSTSSDVNPAAVVHIGQQVEVMVLEVDEERRYMSLGLKQCQQAETRGRPTGTERWRIRLPSKPSPPDPLPASIPNSPPETPKGVRRKRTYIKRDAGAKGVIQEEEGRESPQSSPRGPGYRWPAALDHEFYLQGEEEAFTGRVWLFEEIRNWLASEGGSGGLLITAGPGVGKSAFLSEYVRGFRGRGVLAWHFCRHDRPETLQGAKFVWSLAAQLARMIPEYRESIESFPYLQKVLNEAYKQPRRALEEAVLGPLAGLPKPEVARLLVVDGLDESLAGPPGPGLVELLGDAVPHLPAWLRILAASRAVPEAVSRLGSGFKALEIAPEDARNLGDLQQHVLGVGSRLGGRLEGRSRAAGLLCYKSGGQFLFVRHALRERAAGRLPIAALAQWPPGMKGFYRHSFGRRFGENAEDYAQVRALLGVMCVAHEPLAAVELAQILEVRESEVRSVQEQIPDFITLRVENRRALLSFEHLSLRDWLTQRTSGLPVAEAFAVDPAEASTRLGRWARWRVAAGTAHLSPYLLRQLAKHLADGADRQAVYSQLLLKSFEWSQAQLNLEGLRGLLADVEHLGADPEAALLRALILYAEPALRDSANQWAAQVLGRLGVGSWNIALESLATSAQRWASTPRGADAPLVPVHRSLVFETGLRAQLDGICPMVALAAGRIACARANHVCVWEPGRGGEPQVLKGHTEPITALAALPGGRVVSASRDKSLRVWSLDGVPARVLEGHRYGVTVLAVLPDGRVVSGGEDKTVRVWSLDGSASQVFEGHTAAVTALAVLPDGRVVSGSGSRDKSVRVWSLDGTAAHVLEGHAGLVSGLGVLPDGRVVSASHDSVRVWRLDGSAPQVLEGHKANFSALAVLPDGRVVCGSYDKKVRLWSPDGGGCEVLEGHTRAVTALAVLPDGRLLSGGADGARVWSLDGANAAAVKAHAAPVTAFAVLADGRVACASAEQSVRVWSLMGGATQMLEQTYAPWTHLFRQGHTGGATALAILPDGRVVSASYDKSVRVWSVGGGFAQVLEGHSGWVTALAVHADGRIISASADSMRIWNPDGSAQVLTGRTGVFAVLSDGRMVSAAGAILRVWNVDGGPGQVLEGHELPVTAVAVLPDGRIVSTSVDKTVRIWNLDGGAVQVLEGHTEEVSTLAVLPDGRVVSGSRDKTVRVWSLDGTPTRVLRGHTGWISALSVLPDGRLVSGSEDKTVRVWSYSFEIQHSFIADDPIRCLAATPSGVIVAGCERFARAGFGQGTVHILRLPPEADAGRIGRSSARNSQATELTNRTGGADTATPGGT